MHNPRPHISVVAPAYRCSECIPELCRRLKLALERIDPNFEIVLVNDCSPDRDWEVIQQEARADSRVKGINFSRNFGQHYAIAAGVDYACGDWVVVMDCDLQDQPEEIVKLYRKAVDEDYEIVFGRRAQRQDTLIKKFTSRVYNIVLNTLSPTHIDPATCNFSITSSRVMRHYRKIRECNRSHGLTLLWCGFRIGYVDIEHAQRYAGKTTYNLSRSINLAIESITSQSNKPLRLSIKAGFAISGLSFMMGLFFMARKLIWGSQVSGWTSMIVSLYFISGLLMMNMGVIGLYLGKVFDEAKKRPIYIVRDTLNIPGEDEGDEPEHGGQLAAGAHTERE